MMISNNPANPACTMPRDDILFNLAEGLKAEERALVIYEDLDKILSKIPSTKEDREAILRIIADENRHIEIVKGLINIVKEYYTD